MSPFNLFKNKTAVDADGDMPDISYQMNDFSVDARRRSEMFIKVAKQQGFEVLPGRYGGEYNNDMLAAGEKNGQFMLILGMKITGSDGGIQLDKHSMGAFLQLSKSWLEMVVYSLRLSDKHSSIADKIEMHTQQESISLAVTYIDMDTKQLNMLPLNIQK